MARSVPMGRDRLGILGGPVGAVAALSGTHANHAIGTNDFILEWSCAASKDNGATYTLLFTAAAGVQDLYVYYRHDTNRLRLEITGIVIAYLNPGVVLDDDRLHHMKVFADRDGNAYLHVDGVLTDTVSIAAGAAAVLDSTAFEVWARYPAYRVVRVWTQARLFVISPANFPTAAQRAAIAAERYVNPDAESPTLLARANYAAERRVDIGFVDTASTATVVVNNGTGAATFTVGGGLTWASVCKRAEIVPISRPASNVFTLDTAHTAQTAAEAYGLAVRPLVVRFLHGELRNGGHSGSTWGVQNAAGTAYIRIYATNPATIQVQAKDAGGAVQSYSLAREQLDKGDLWVTANGTAVTIYQNGQRIAALTVGAAIDLTGNCQVSGDGKLRVCRLELWNPAAIPAGFVADMMATTMRPESVSTTLGTPILDYFTDSSIVAGATAIPNDGSAGGAGMVISGAGTYGASRTLLWGGV